MTESEAWPLAGMRVVDLTTEIAGPYATKLLVDAGADVVKVESPEGGDPLRRWSASKSPIPDGEDGGLFQYLNASKRSVALDIEREQDRAKLRALVAAADIVIESFAPGTLERLGLSLETLQRGNPKLSWVSITPWGQTGPWVDRPSTEFTLQAQTGSIGYRGLPGRKPVAAGGRFGEYAAGVFAAVGAMSAWLSARRTGEGQHVDVSMFEAVLLCMTIYHDLDGQWKEGPLPRAIEIPSIEPAKDGWVGFCTITGQQWTDFCAMIGQQEVGENRAYLDGTLRMEHKDFMQEIIHSWTRERTIDEIIELALLFRIPVTPVGNGRSVLEIDHFQARGIYVDAPGGFKQPRPPYRLEKTSLRPLAAAPRLGEHTNEVLNALDSAPTRERAGEGGGALPFGGLKVLDLSAFWAGPIAGSFLADMGADVLKVESIQRPDGMRFAGSVMNETLWEWSPVFHGANPGKRDVTLQMDHEEGIALVERLIADSDVLIENYSARVLEKFGLGWEQVREINPRIIMVRMPAFGLDGPWRDRAGFAMTIEQVSGLAWITGYEDLPLVLRGGCDPIGGMHAILALMMALEHRRRSGEGQLVEVALAEVALNVAAEQVIEYTSNGVLLERDENRGPVSAPQGVYDCLDGEELAIAVATDEHWRSLCEVLGDPAWARDASLADEAGRRAAHDLIDRELDAWCSKRVMGDLVAALVHAGVPAAPIANARFVHPNPQLDHRQFFQTLVHPITGETRYPGLPMNFSILGAQLHRSPPPTLGQHNDEVLREELGLTEDEVAALDEARVIGTRPSFM